MFMWPSVPVPQRLYSLKNCIQLLKVVLPNMPQMNGHHHYLPNERLIYTDPAFQYQPTGPLDRAVRRSKADSVAVEQHKGCGLGGVDGRTTHGYWPVRVHRQ